VPAPPVDRRDPHHTIQPDGRQEHTLTLPEVAAVLKVTVRTVRKLIQNGELRAIRVSPRVTRVTERALEEFIEERSGGPA